MIKTKLSIAVAIVTIIGSLATGFIWHNDTFATITLVKAADTYYAAQSRLANIDFRLDYYEDKLLEYVYEEILTPRQERRVEDLKSTQQRLYERKYEIEEQLYK